jgi:hypothetical protein
MDITDNDKRRIEGYAEALQAIEYALTGENGCGKSYDPMTIEGDTMHSYAFDMLDGGRHHPIEDYEDVQHIKSVLLAETVTNIIEERRLEETN